MLAARDLVVTLGGHPALHGVSMALQPGTVTAICGPNGAGKSTLLGSLAGLIAPLEGGITLEDVPLGKMPARRRAQAIGFLPQTGEVAWDVSVAHLAALGRLPYGDSEGAGRAHIDAALAAMGLEPLADRPVSQLSGGERARALLARVLAGDPRWILADEPLAALDLAHQLALLVRLKEAARTGTGVVLVVHDLALAMNHAQRVVVLDQGRVAADGPPQEALSEAVIARVWGVTARWLGEPGARALSAG